MSSIVYLKGFEVLYPWSFRFFSYFLPHPFFCILRQTRNTQRFSCLPNCCAGIKATSTTSSPSLFSNSCNALSILKKGTHARKTGSPAVTQAHLKFTSELWACDFLISASGVLGLEACATIPGWGVVGGGVRKSPSMQLEPTLHNHMAWIRYQRAERSSYSRSFLWRFLGRLWHRADLQDFYCGPPSKADGDLLLPRPLPHYQAGWRFKEVGWPVKSFNAFCQCLKHKAL